MSATHHSKVLILGSGPAGLTAAIYAARAMLEPILVHGLQPGGQMTITTDVENFPGFPDVIQGPWLMEQMQRQAEHVGTRFHHDIIVDIDFSQRPFVARGDSGDIYTGDTVIISTGAQAKWLGLEGEETLKGFGLSACATCDGFFYRNRKVAVVGGGNTAVEEALYLTNHADKVYLIHRRDELRAEKMLQERLFANPKIEMVWNATIDSYLSESAHGGPASVTGARLKNTNDGSLTDLLVDGVFIAIGHAPATSLFADKLELDNDGYLITQADSTRTGVPGVFAAGDVQDKIFRQAVTAAGTGCMAALEAERFLAGTAHHGVEVAAE
ncbi:thioredoxin reductase [Tistrella bauzanensis]|uniref:Thioredoxin reductase n=1 Tax=Tistrella bauzanensis TaxID=657419 RepID=A0ABQ1I7F1_9PROT|nr:thioredoxin-disulfide reductase [Tistrella bauzanensis]GGB24270.1 thioredoxin reductase [Tistrella bauzanensis]